MDKYKKEKNAGGVNGSGKGIVNTNSKEYKALQQAIIEHSKTLSHSDKIRYDLVALKYQMQKYVSLAEPKLFKEAGNGWWWYQGTTMWKNSYNTGKIKKLAG